ncbi:ParA family protein (plasmid) [Rubrobacter marinus]|uniref:ParA family protein n=1 Tax=Rubrobacter marinus TaxID=2653852 RepID=A0A6G8Q390_9ACTN|nr:ParA family protein [Rubrobacter marinus]QIN80964.1 ParA family protein [Rubrobacter marinus]
MRINVLGDKGGVGKSVTAVHLAAVLGLRFGEATTALVDADPNGSVLRWRERGRRDEGEGEEAGWPFEVMGPEDGGGWTRYENVVFDSQGRPSEADLRAAVEGSDLIVVPTTPEGLAINTLMPFVEAIEEMGGRDRYRVLITMAPWWNRSASHLGGLLEREGIPAFRNHVRRRQAFDTAAVTGRLVYELSDRRARDGWRDYEAVGEEAIEAIMGARRRTLRGR